MASKSKEKTKERVKAFKQLKNYYWVGVLPFYVDNGEIIQLSGVRDEKLVEKLQNYLKRKK